MAAAVRTTPPPWASWPNHRKQDHRPPVSFFSNPNPHDPNITNQRSGFPLRQRGITLSAISGSSGKLPWPFLPPELSTWKKWEDGAFFGSSSKVISEDPITLLEGVQVLDLSGKPFPITNLWNDRKAVIAFARHFGCVLCRKRADFLASKKDVMDAAGVALVLIGPGSVEQAKAFSVQTKFQGEIYADPSHSSFKALNFVYGVSTTFTPWAGLKIIQSYMEGYRQDWGLSFQKDTVAKGGWQQGGILVAGPGVSNISYIHKDKEAGDDPAIEDILKACCS